jgi:hypothetical protein
VVRRGKLKRKRAAQERKDMVRNERILMGATGLFIDAEKVKALVAEMHKYSRPPNVYVISNPTTAGKSWMQAQYLGMDLAAKPKRPKPKPKKMTNAWLEGLKRRRQSRNEAILLGERWHK